MHIKSLITDADKEELEGMLLLGLKSPEHAVKKRRINRILIYIFTLVEIFMICIDCFFAHYETLWMSIVGCIIGIVGLVLGKKFEKSIHEFVCRMSKYDEIDINENEIKISESQIFEFENIDRMFLYKNFFFFITDEKKICIFKASEEELDEVVKIIEKAGVLFERRDRPFNIYKYCKRGK